MLNTAPKRSLTRRSRYMLVVGFIIASVGVFMTSLGLFLRLVPTFFGQGTTAAQLQTGIGTTFVVLGAVTLLAGLGVIIRALTRRRENDLAFITGEHLKPIFDERYRFIRNINQPKLGYIDAVLVGPPGVLVFRILQRAGQLFNQKGGWVHRDRNGEWVPMRVNPTKEARVDVIAMREFLAKHRMPDVEVYGVVVFVNEPPELTIQIEDPVVPVAHLSGFVDAIENNYLAKERISPQRVERIQALLLGDM